MPEPDWSQFPAGGRQATLCRALQRLWELVPGPATIVETGTTRDATEEGRKGDGWSTLAFAWYAAQVGGQVWTIDLLIENLDTAYEIVRPYQRRVYFIAEDSVQYLRIHAEDGREPIHLLYLDSLDYHPHQQAESEAHHLAEAEAALPALAPTCLVLFDDTGVEIDGYFGKGARAILFLLKHGFVTEWCEGGQVLLSRVETLP